MSRAPESAPELDDGDRALLVRVRALRERGVEPAWDRFERDLARQLDEVEARRSRRWWLRLWKPTLGLALAGAAVAAVLFAGGDDTAAPERVATPVLVDAAPAPTALLPVPLPDDADRPLALGAVGELEVDELDEAVLDDVLAELSAGAPVDDLAGWTAWDDPPEDGLVPDLDLEWVDGLDDNELEAIDRWLDDEAG